MFRFQKFHDIQIDISEDTYFIPSVRKILHYRKAALVKGGFEISEMYSVKNLQHTVQLLDFF